VVTYVIPNLSFWPRPSYARHSGRKSSACSSSQPLRLTSRSLKRDHAIRD
jgi:hypothetical protein